MVAADPEKPRALSREEVFEKLTPFVAAAVERMVRRNSFLASDREDMTQAGLMALWAIAGDYDPAAGANLKTFAGQRITGAIIDHLRDKRNAFGMQARVCYSRKKAGHHVPTCASLDASVGNKGEHNPAGRSLDLAATVPSFDPEHSDDPAAELKAAIGRTGAVLAAKERDVLVEYMTSGLTMKEIATAHGISESLVSQRVASAVRLIRVAMIARGMTSFN